MLGPGGEPVARRVAHRALLGRRPERVGNACRRPLVVGRERDPHVAVVEDRVVLAVGLLDMVEALRDQEGPHAVAGEEGEAGLEEVEPSQRRKLVRSEERRVGKEGGSTGRSRWSTKHEKKKENNNNKTGAR